MADIRSRLELAHRLHRTERWVEACDEFLAVDEVEPLAAKDLELLAESAQVMGRGELAVAALRRAYGARVASGDINRAIAIAFWLWQALVISGEVSRAAGWAALMRGHVRHRPEGGDAGPEETSEAGNSGWLLVTDAHGLIRSGRYDEAVGVLETAARLGSLQAEADLKAFATTLWGRALVKAGRLGEGLTHLDEAMVAIVDRDTTPRATSMLYCSAIATCLEAHEWSRAREWTLALGAWLDELPHQSGVYFGNCRIYRSLLWRLRGDWTQALQELDEVCGELREGFGQRIAGHAWYELGELHRLLGDAEAANDYRRARERGAEDQPGLALLRLSQGETAAAVAGIRRALAEAPDPLARLGLLPACVQIMLAAGDREAAGSAAEESPPRTIRPWCRRNVPRPAVRWHWQRAMSRPRLPPCAAPPAPGGNWRRPMQWPPWLSWWARRAGNWGTMRPPTPSSSPPVIRSHASVRSPTCAGSRSCSACSAGYPIRPARTH
jgi:tetratricopeptide (TPR) repeat protein